MNKHLIFSIVLFLIANILVWYQANLQFMSEWWHSRPMLTITLSAFPVAFCFYFAWREGVYATGSFWTVRFLAFSLSFLVFPPMTYYLLGESMFTAKTTTCMLLAGSIMMIQLFWN